MRCACSICLVTITVPAALSVSEGVAGGTVEVCAELSGASPDTRTTSIISATLATIESSWVSTLLHYLKYTPLLFCVPLRKTSSIYLGIHGYT
jgi:hypothetical protein